MKDTDRYEAGTHCSLVGHEYLITKSGRECRKCGRVEVKVYPQKRVIRDTRKDWLEVLLLCVCVILGCIGFYIFFSLIYGAT